MATSGDSSVSTLAVVVGILKISKVPFWFLWTTPLLVGYFGSAADHGFHDPVWFVLLVVATWVCDATASIHNELVDREEDAVNQPERAAFLRSLPEKVLWRVVWAGYLTLAIGAVPFTIYVGLVPAAILLAAGVAAPLYNWGPRFKRVPPLPQIVFGWVAACEVAGAWAFNAPWSTVSPIVWVVALFIAAASVSKDLPDVEGDEAVGAASIFSIEKLWQRATTLVVVHTSPYVLVLILVAVGALPARVLWVLVLLPVVLSVVYCGERAQTTPAMIALYEVSYTYVHAFLLMLLVLMWPSVLAVVVSIAMFGVRIIAVMMRLQPRIVGDEFTVWNGLKELAVQRSGP